MEKTSKHYVWIFLLVIAFGADCVAGQDEFGTELAVNGDFGKGEIGKLPDYWGVVCPNEALAPKFELVEGGSGNLLMVQGNGRRECFGYIRQKVELPNDKTFHMKVRFRIEGIEDVNRHLVHGVWGAFNNGIFEYKRVGDWIEGENRFAGKGGQCEIRLYFRFSEHGKVWWDKVSLTECEPIEPRLVKVAVAQGNRDREGWQEFLDIAGKKKCDVALLTEFFEPKVQEMNGDAMQFMSRKAKQWAMYVSGSLKLNRGDVEYNSAPLYDRQGNLVGIYDKVMLYDPEMDGGRSPGWSVPVFDTDFGKVGIMICYDSWHPSVAKLLALKGAELILFPSAAYYTQLMHARAADNGVVIAATSSGSPCGVWDGGGNRADGLGNDDSRCSPSAFVDFENMPGKKMQIVTLDLSKKPSPHYWGGPMRSAPGGRRVRATNGFYLEDEISREVRRWWSDGNAP